MIEIKENEKNLGSQDASRSAYTPHIALRNHEGYPDPTPKIALEQEEYEARKRDAKKVIMTLQNVAHIAGYNIKGRITIIDNYTGYEWR